MKNRLPAALLALADKLDDEPGFAGLWEANRYRLADVCRKLAAHPTPDKDEARAASRAILGAVHAAILTCEDDPIPAEDQVRLIASCLEMLAGVGS